MRRHNVTAGYRSEEFFIAESGLRAGDRIIVEGVQKVRPGSPASAQVDETLLARIPQTPEAAQKLDAPEAVRQDDPSILGNTLAPVGEVIEGEIPAVPVGK